jgi:DNA-binding GntR family transcriptional regulator
MAISEMRMSPGPQPQLPFQPAPLRRATGEPLYAQVARDLAGHVRRGTMAAGQRLPPEPALATAYGVNRLTVREALTSLTRQGLVRRVQGVGSFVAETPVRHRIGGDEASLTEAMRKQGLSVRQDLLEAAGAPPEAVPGGPFPDFPGPVTILWIRRWVQDIPWSLTLTWLPAALVGRDVPFRPDTSLFALLRDHHGLTMTRTERTFGAAPAAPSDSEHLDVATGAPLIVLSGGNVDQHGRRIAQVSHRIRGDRAEYVVDFRAQGPA